MADIYGRTEWNWELMSHPLGLWETQNGSSGQI
jgi:hypothetical protein